MTLPPAGAWREAKQLLWRYRRGLGIGFALMIVNRLAGFVLPGSTKFLIDDVVGLGRHELLVPLVAAVGGATLVQAVSTFALAQVVSVAAQGAIMDMRRRVQERVTRLPIRFFDGTRSGVLISRIMTDAEGIRNLVGTGIIQLVGGTLTAGLALGVLFYLNWLLTVSILGFLVVFAVAMTIAFSRLRPIFRERGEINAQVTGRLAETLGGIRVVKAYRMEEREQRVFSQGVERLFANVKRSITGTSAATAFATVIVGAVGVLMILVGGRAILSGAMTLGDLVMYAAFVAILAAPVVQIAAIGTQVSEAFAGLDRIRGLLAEPAEDDDEAARAPLGRIAGDVEFDAVHFAYEPGSPVLRGVSLRAPAGTTTALVGSSGSGKSTLVGLAMAFNRPDSGRVTVDGVDLAQVKLGDYRRQLGVVLQENFLFDGTIAENIRFARPDATLDEVEAVGRLAHAHEFVSAFADGYDTVVGERGIKLSGGQRQRIAIARALLADPRILILDEATSSLDSESEGLIQAGLERLRHGRTSFVIAHRLSTIRRADQILVLEGGEIVERGTHPELYARGGRYRELHDRQHAWEGNAFVNPGEDDPRMDDLGMVDGRA
ncbi:MAG: ABC transporter ATP-binding protein [Trueperaceae bacterium]|nr:MAG: ABC transporter ATP-binding protein [Trueperaceae bacterium]